MWEWRCTSQSMTPPQDTKKTISRTYSTRDACPTCLIQIVFHTIRQSTTCWTTDSASVRAVAARAHTLVCTELTDDIELAYSSHWAIVVNLASILAICFASALVHGTLGGGMRSPCWTIGVTLTLGCTIYAISPANSHSCGGYPTLGWRDFGQ